MLITWSEGDVRDILGQHPEWGIGGMPARVRRLGVGESYEAWRVAAGVVARVARRPREELPAAPEEEFAALQLAPEGLAPQGIALTDIDREGVVLPCFLESFVPGRRLTARDWDDELRARLAAVFARLHQWRWAAPGPVTAALAPAGGAVGPGSCATGAGSRPDFSAEVAGAVDWWTPRLGVAEAAAWRPLVAPMQAYGRELQGEFAEVRDFALLHRDPVLTNILVQERQPRLIDWEWARIGDPARDLGLVGGAVHAAPWYAPISGEQVDLMLRAYLAAGGRGEFEALRRRRDAWLALEAFTVSAYLMWVVAENPADHPRWRRAAARQLLDRLSEYLRPWGASSSGLR